MRAKRAAFTLIELLVVIVIIAILAALLFAGIAAAQRMAKRTQAKTAVKNIALGLELYFAEYHRWPPFSVTAVMNPETTPVPVNGNVAKMLQGEDFSNPKKIPFVQFKTFADPAPDVTKPVNPWWTEGSAVSNFFYYKVDVNFDNQISAGAPTPTNAVRRSVLVWTINGDNGSFVSSHD